MKLDLVTFVLPAFASTGSRLSRGSSGVTPWALPMSAGGAGTESETPLTSTLQISQLMYEFQDLRTIVSTHEKYFNMDLTESEKEEVGIVEFNTPALVDTRNSAANPFPAAKLKNPVSAAAVLEFLKLNTNYIRHEEGSNMEFVPSGDNTELPFTAKKLTALQEKFDADIAEFDDEFANNGLKSTLVYSIVVNRKSKRITVVFRGSVTPKDWLVDLRFFSSTPKIIQDFTGDGSIKIHKGFSGYLLDDTVAEGEAKIDQIISVLKELYAYKDEAAGRDYSDYSLYVTGHSLGGALTQLLGFVLAGSKKADFIPKPIIAISFASPVVGDSKGFLKAHQDLEKAGKLRHIRVSNQNDVVPGCALGYTQTGVNMHAEEGKKMEIGYSNPKNVLTQLNLGSIARHNLEGEGSYYSRLYCKNGKGELLNAKELEKSIDQLYADYAGIE